MSPYPIVRHYRPAGSLHVRGEVPSIDGTDHFGLGDIDWNRTAAGRPVYIDEQYELVFWFVARVSGLRAWLPVVAWRVAAENAITERWLEGLGTTPWGHRELLYTPWGYRELLHLIHLLIILSAPDTPPDLPEAEAIPLHQARPPGGQTDLYPPRF